MFLYKLFSENNFIIANFYVAMSIVPCYLCFEFDAVSNFYSWVVSKLDAILFSFFHICKKKLAQYAFFLYLFFQIRVIFYRIGCIIIFTFF